jgi:hypothetical protein
MEDFGAHCARARRRSRAAELRGICTEGRPYLSLAPFVVLPEAPLANKADLARKRARQGPCHESLLPRVEAFLGGLRALRAVSRAPQSRRRLRILAKPAPLASAPRVVFVHDGAPGFVARRVALLGLPPDIDVVVPAPLLENYLREWRFVFPEARLCRSGDARERSAESRRRARSGDTRGVRLWSARDFLKCADRDAVVVAEEMQDWPPGLAKTVAAVRARAVVVGCSGIGARLCAMLPRPSGDARVYRVGHRGAGKIMEPYPTAGRLIIPDDP